MQQRLAQKRLQGVYQIGDVYARSVVVIGVSPGILTP
jgi:hypothetical protein